MRSFVFSAILLAIPGSAMAQPPVAEAHQTPRYTSAPWWMAQPIIASPGSVYRDVKANRARFSASFQAISRTSPEATRQAADKVRALAQQLGALGAEKVRVETSFSQRPIYEQYRDKDGNLLSNQRADKIDSYEVNANVSVEVRDVSLVERIYGMVLAAKPTTTQPVYFSLEVPSALNTEMYGLAVADAKRRAELSVANSGAKLGQVKLIDPTGRACETDVLVDGAERSGTFVPPQEVDVRSLPAAIAEAPPPPPPPPPPAPGGGRNPTAEDMQMPLQPPLQRVSATACIIYSLN